MIKIKDIGRELIRGKEDFVLASVVDTSGSTPRKKGAWLLMRKDGTCYGTVGGGKLEAETERIAKETFMTRESKIYHFGLKPEDQNGIDMRCGGDADIKIEYISAENSDNFAKEMRIESRAVIFGAGHVGLALESVIRTIGFQTIVVDDRKEYANSERFPNATQVEVIESFSNPFACIETDKDTYVIIVTRGHSGDYDVLRETLKRTTGYIGMIGSKGKVATVYEMLKADGYTEDDLGKVYSPIGLKIGAETPEEIAISIAGEMIKVRAENEK